MLTEMVYNSAMRNVPFIPNSDDDMHCVNADFRMVYRYFFNEDFTWEEIDKLTKAIPGKATWTFIGEMEFAKKGLNIRNIEPLDYNRLHTEGTEYLQKTFGDKTANYYIEKSNISSVIKYIPEYIKTVEHETRKAPLDEIIQLLKDDCLIGAEINSRILNDKPGFSLHFVLLYGFDGENIILHDPGFPAIKARKVTLKMFDKCYNFEGANGGITVFTKPKQSVI